MPSAFDSVPPLVQSQLDGLQASIDQGLPSVVAFGSGNLTSVAGWNDQVLTSLTQSSHNIFSINSSGNLSIPGAGLYLVGMVLATSNVPTGIGIKYILNAGGILVNRGYTHTDAADGFWAVSGAGIAVKTNSSPISFRFFFNNTTQLTRAQAQYFCVKLS